MSIQSNRELIFQITKSKVATEILKKLNALDVSLLNSSNDCIVMAQTAIRISALKKALELSHKAVELEPDSLALNMSLATAYMFLRDNIGARNICFNVINKFGDGAEVFNLIGHTYSGQGDFERAEKWFRKALNIENNYALAITGLSRCRKFTSDYEEIINLFKKAFLSKMDIESQSKVHFSIAKVYNDCGKYEKAWQHAKNANTLLQMSYPFKEKSFVSEQIDRLIHHNMGEMSSGKSKDEHVLIVGMPRSGTTLMEQIVGGHRKYFPGGEVPAIEYSLAFGAPEKTSLARFSESKLDECAKAYKNYFCEFNYNYTDRIINKVPLNFLNVGIFKQMFPNAKIIYMKRDYRDVSASIFFEQFSTQMNYTSSLADTFFMFSECVRIMTFWQEKFTQDVICIEYENLISNFDFELGRVAEFLKVEQNEFEDHRETKNSVETPSLWQVRQRVYSSSCGRYKNYKALSGLPDSFGGDASIDFIG